LKDSVLEQRKQQRKRRLSHLLRYIKLRKDLGYEKVSATPREKA